MRIAPIQRPQWHLASIHFFSRLSLNHRPPRWHAPHLATFLTLLSFIPPVAPIKAASSLRPHSAHLVFCSPSIGLFSPSPHSSGSPPFVKHTFSPFKLSFFSPLRNSSFSFLLSVRERILNTWVREVSLNLCVETEPSAGFNPSPNHLYILSP